MTSERPFWQKIQEQVALRSNQADDAILAELKLLPVLPDENFWFGKTGLENPVWSEDATEKHLLTYLALVDIIRVRKLKPGVLLILERASYGDMGETMRGLRHTLEAVYKPDWEALADVCMQAARYPQRGARLWAVDELGTLRDTRAVPLLSDMLHDSAMLVRHQAIRALRMLSIDLPEIQPAVLRELENTLAELEETCRELRASVDEIRSK